MESAMSGFFVLILNNHKLVYLPETADAPSLDTFASTLQTFFRIKHRGFIDATYQERRLAGIATTKRELYGELPLPEVEIVPLASRASIEQFMAHFQKLTQLEFRIRDTNQEFPMRETYQRLREMKHSLGSQNTKLLHSNPQGLNKEEAMEQIHASAAGGNQSVQLAGSAPDGTKLRGDNDHFKIQVPVDDLPADPRERALRMITIYNQEREQGVIVEDAADDSAAKIQRLRERMNE